MPSDPVFGHLGTALLRSPLLPVGTLRAPAAPDPGDETDETDATDEAKALRAAVTELTDDPLLLEALALSSPSLGRRLESVRAGGDVSLSALRRTWRAVLRYRARMAGRPTPFGLLAGVAPIRFGDTARVRLGSAHAKSARPDAEWLACLTRRWERDPAILAGLRLSANGLCVRRGDRLVLPYAPAAPEAGPGPAQAEEPREVSVRWTAAVAAAYEHAHRPVTHAALTEHLRARMPAAPAGAIEELVTELVTLGFLLTDLSPPPGAADPLAQVTGRLAGVPAATGEARRLAGVAAALADYAEHRPGQGLLALRAAEDRMGALTQRPHCLAVDTALDADITLPYAVAEEARRAADLLWRLGPPVTGTTRPLASYHRDFLERYGLARAVPVPELLDPVGGLGPPLPDATTRAGARDRVLTALAQEATASGAREIVLSDRDLHALGDDSGVPPPSTELVFQLLTPSEQALKAGEFTLVVSAHLTGTWPAGSLAARFAHLLPEAGRQLAGTAPTALAGAASPNGPILPVQLVFRPALPRAGNVVRTPRWVEHTVATGTFGEGSDPGHLALDDLAVVGEPDRLRLVSLRHGGQEVAAGTFHMLDTRLLAPAHVRLLHLLSIDHVRPLLGWDWGTARDWPWLPAVRHGRTVLCRSRWLVRDADVLDHRTGFTAWSEALGAWRRRLRVPDVVEAGSGDRLLPLDLSRTADARLLREELRRDPDTPLHERPDLTGDGTGWLTGPHGTHAAEISVPLLRRAPSAATPAPAALAVTRRPSVRRGDDPARGLPGGSWLYAKLYCPGPLQDTVLARHLPELLDALPPEADRWFFVRYADPDPHLRLRLHGDPRTLYGEILPALHDLAADLRRQRLVGRLVLDTYDPETERYGGTARTMEAAERVFHADSAAALAQLRLLDHARPPAEPLPLTAAGRAHLAWHLVPGTPAERARRLLAVTPRDEHHRAFRDHRAEALRLVDPFGDFAALCEETWAAPLLAAWQTRAAAADSLRQCLAETPADTDADPVLASLLHMHHNRLTADPTPWSEGRVAAVARGAVAAHLARREARAAP
ncbi:lantibiotic dehydratase [Streptomyces sp. NPDC057099]|uniref:lantibiotic dehydratase n=1 Tax=Streptomyces sp. NPDC057099 TaxID=3346019 RepID=UPI00363AEF15